VCIAVSACGEGILRLSRYYLLRRVGDKIFWTNENEY
jgi:hypothetical protein